MNEILEYIKEHPMPPLPESVTEKRPDDKHITVRLDTDLVLEVEVRPVITDYLPGEDTSVLHIRLVRWEKDGSRPVLWHHTIKDVPGAPWKDGGFVHVSEHDWDRLG